MLYILTMEKIQYKLNIFQTCLEQVNEPFKMCDT